MKYVKNKTAIEILDVDDFDITQILECGQIFSYEKVANGDFWVYSKDKRARVVQENSKAKIITDDVDYFENFFDLTTDYSKIKADLAKFDILKRPIEFGGGIRILKQDLFETLISFIVSANNNIKRIKMILHRIREKFGKNMGEYHAFATREQLLSATVQDFVDIGAGYRAKYLFDVLRQVDENTLEQWRTLESVELAGKLINLSGVGPKVADCVMLFGFSKFDIFPVDTWIAQMYNKFFEKEENRLKIRRNLIAKFGDLSGYAQQYLFYSTREKEIFDFS